MKMKVLSSAVDLYSDYKLEQQKTVNERLKAWVDGQGTDANDETEPTVDSLTLSGDALAKLQEDPAVSSSETTAESEDEFFELSPREKEIISLLEKFLSKLSGKKVTIDVPDKLTLSGPGNSDFGHLMAAKNDGNNNGNGSQRVGWGINYHYEESYTEKESMNFSAQGTILTEDGSEIKFKLNIATSREYTAYQRIDIKAGDALIDPLVVNYGAGGASLSGFKTDFDLNADGTQDTMSFLAEGSGFLALDENSDGVINDGSELFGPTSGDGFGELAEYDNDQNGWVDENDSIYKELSLWIKDAAGNDQLLALSQVGIGAIYLGNVDSLFSLKDTDNHLDAQIKETGIFLKENGEAGTIQHVDFAV
jgi:hypothetical protein